MITSHHMMGRGGGSLLYIPPKVGGSMPGNCLQNPCAGLCLLVALRLFRPWLRQSPSWVWNLTH